MDIGRIARMEVAGFSRLVAVLSAAEIVAHIVQSKIRYRARQATARCRSWRAIQRVAGTTCSGGILPGRLRAPRRIDIAGGSLLNAMPTLLCRWFLFVP